MMARVSGTLITIFEPRPRTDSMLNGSINIYSTKGQGSKIVIKVPLTLAIMPTLMVMLGN